MAVDHRLGRARALLDLDIHAGRAQAVLDLQSLQTTALQAGDDRVSTFACEAVRLLTSGSTDAAMAASASVGFLDDAVTAMLVFYEGRRCLACALHTARFDEQADALLRTAEQADALLRTIEQADALLRTAGASFHDLAGHAHHHGPPELRAALETCASIAQALLGVAQLQTYLQRDIHDFSCSTYSLYTAEHNLSSTMQCLVDAGAWTSVLERSRTMCIELVEAYELNAHASLLVNFHSKD